MLKNKWHYSCFFPTTFLFISENPLCTVETADRKGSLSRSKLESLVCLVHMHQRWSVVHRQGDDLLRGIWALLLALHVYGLPMHFVCDRNGSCKVQPCRCIRNSAHK